MNTLLRCVGPEPLNSLSSATDPALLSAWTEGRDETALGELVHRYACLVLGVCRRQCRLREDVEDAFQATFLQLARRSGQIRHPERLAAWLHSVAYRTACRVRTRTIRSPDSLTVDPPDPADPLGQVALRHELRVLDEELSKLPAHYRQPLVLHYLEGCSTGEVAVRLGASEGAVRGWMQRGRRQLQRRLVRRGLGLAAVTAALGSWQTHRAAAAEMARHTLSDLGSEALGGSSSPLDPLIPPESSPMFYSSLFALGGGAAALAAVLALAPAGADGEHPRAIALAQVPPAQDEARVAVVPPTLPPDAAEMNFQMGMAGGGGMGGMGGVAGMGMGGMGMGMGMPPQLPAAREPSVAEQRIRERLDAPVSFSLEGGTLGTAFEELAQQFGLPIFAAPEDLARVGAELDQPVDLQVQQMVLQSALRLLLARHGLSFRVDDDLVRVVPDTAALARQGKGMAEWIDMEPEMAEQLDEVLTRQLSDVEFFALPLDEVLRTLAKDSGVEIFVDTRSLEEVALSADVPVSVTMSRPTLERVLQRILQEHDLTLTVRGSALVVLSQVAAEEELLARIYWLDETGFEQSVGDAVEAIQSAISRNAWEEMGGTSTIAPLFGAEGSRSGLVVSTTLTTHRRIDRLLQKLREGSFRGRPAPQAQPLLPGMGGGMGVGGMGGGMGMM